MQHREDTMSNGLFLTPDELVRFMADSHRDEKGNIVYGSDAAEVLEIAMERARQDDENTVDDSDVMETPLTVIEQAQAEKREKKKLKGKNLDKYIAIAKRLIDNAQKEFDNGGKLMSKRAFAAGLELLESTVRQNHTLNEIYERFKADNSNVRPSTVNNDPDSFFDDNF